jgi:hypothetical protein
MIFLINGRLLLLFLYLSFSLANLASILVIPNWGKQNISTISLFGDEHEDALDNRFEDVQVEVGDGLQKILH